MLVFFSLCPNPARTRPRPGPVLVQSSYIRLDILLPYRVYLLALTRPPSPFTRELNVPIERLRGLRDPWNPRLRILSSTAQLLQQDSNRMGCLRRREDIRIPSGTRSARHGTCAPHCSREFDCSEIATAVFTAVDCSRL